MASNSGPTCVYVACADSDEIVVLQLDAGSGDLTLLQRMPAGGSVMPLAPSHDRRHLFAALRSVPYRVASFAVEPLSGRLLALGSGPLPASTPYIAVDPTGQYLLWASYSGHQIGVSAIGGDGIVCAAHQVMDTEPNAHAIVLDRAGRHAYVPCLGGGAVLVWKFDACSGRLSPNAPARIAQPAGAGPRHFVFHPAGGYAYLLNELDATVSCFACDAETGLLTQIQQVGMLAAGFSGKPWAADIHLTPDGRFLYASERRSSTLTAFAVGPDGRIDPLAQYATETEPRSFAIDPGGRFLLVAGQASHSLTSYRIDAATGTLATLKRVAMGKNPNWVEIIALP